MGAANTWDAMDLAVQAPQGHGSQILSSSLTIDPSLSPPEMNPRIIELCKDMFKQWSNLDDSRFDIETVSGGITNLLLKVTVKEENSHGVSITIRLYGPYTEYIINRERELQATKYISAAGFGAKWLGIFGNGMVQSFIKARTLSPSDMREPKLVAKIAKQVKIFHLLEVPGSKEPQLWNDIFKFFNQDLKELLEFLKSDTTKNAFYVYASALQFDDAEKQKTYETISFQEVHSAILELKELTDRLASPVVFAHNDLLSGNIMINEEEDKLYIIDYEYASYNFRGFDIGNHFAEYAGYDCDYNLYPDKDEQYHFFRHYLQPDRPHEVTEEDLYSLYVEANTYSLVSHVFWALWGLIQARMSPIDFDYLGYFFLRYNEYKRQKDENFSLAESYLSR